MGIIGQKVKIKKSIENENYITHRNTILVITDVEIVDVGYNKDICYEKLMSFETENGEKFPFSLYEYEIEYI